MYVYVCLEQYKINPIIVILSDWMVIIIHYILMFLHECLDVYIQWKMALEERCQATPWIRNSVDTISKITKKGYNIFFKIRMEPDIDSWSNMSYIRTVYDSLHASHHIYSEEYSEFTDLYDTYDTGIDFFQGGYREGYPNPAGLWIVKYDDTCYYSRVLTLDKIATMPIDMIDQKPSSVRFLSIIYTHPKMDFEVPLELPNSVFFEGNQLLCATYVMRMLEYTWGRSDIKYVFDKNYTLKIMDRNVKYVELSSNDYIELDVNKWIICKII